MGNVFFVKKSIYVPVAVSLLNSSPKGSVEIGCVICIAIPLRLYA